MSKRKVTAKSLRQGQTVYLVVCEVSEPDQLYVVCKIQLKSHKTPFPCLSETTIDTYGYMNIDYLRSRSNHMTNNKKCEYYTEPCKGELVYCKHPDNKVDEEGNCRTDICPLEGEPCAACGVFVQGWTPSYCCSAFDCGCMGRPLYPCVCGENCRNKLTSTKKVSK